jgi:hypothetical protein
VELAVDAVRVEAAGGRFLRGEIDDVEDASGGAAEGQAVAVGGMMLALPSKVMPWSSWPGPSRLSRAREIAFAALARPRSYTTVRMLAAW